MYFFYTHIVLEVRNSSESRALAHSHLISRQSTLAQKDSFTNLLAKRACVPCMSTNVFFLKKCAERSHFRAEFITLLILLHKYFKYLKVCILGENRYPVRGLHVESLAETNANETRFVEKVLIGSRLHFFIFL